MRESRLASIRGKARMVNRFGSIVANSSSHSQFESSLRAECCLQREVQPALALASVSNDLMSSSSLVSVDEPSPLVEAFPASERRYWPYMRSLTISVRLSTHRPRPLSRIKDSSGKLVGLPVASKAPVSGKTRSQRSKVQRTWRKREGRTMARHRLQTHDAAFRGASGDDSMVGLG